MSRANVLHCKLSPIPSVETSGDTAAGRSWGSLEEGAAKQNNSTRNPARYSQSYQSFFQCFKDGSSFMYYSTEFKFPFQNTWGTLLVKALEQLIAAVK